MMGRSVMTLGGTAIVAYTEFEPSHYSEVHDGFECRDNECDSSCDHIYDYQCVLDYYQERVTELWPSFEPADSWVGDELHVIAENAHSIVAVSEYCGLISINLGAKYDRQAYFADDSELGGLGEHWRKQIADKFLSTFGEYAKLGTMSNGEGVFQKVAS